MRVLAIPEDFRKDQYILQPIITALLNAAGKPNAKVRVCTDPLLGGISQALRWERIEEILSRYRGMIDLFVLCVDRDGREGRRQRLDELESKALKLLADSSTPTLFVAENAWQEVEVWVLAGLDLPKDWSWTKVRQEVDAKERYFDVIAAERGLQHDPGGGRKALALEASRHFPRIRSLCPEDVQALDDRIRSWLEAHK